jgi:hypothetical protein
VLLRTGSIGSLHNGGTPPSYNLMHKHTTQTGPMPVCTKQALQLHSSLK